MKMISKRPLYKWLVLLVVQCTILLIGLDSTIINIALPIMTKELHINISISQWILSSFFVGTAVFLSLSGKFADIYGRKKMLIIGLLLITTSFIYCAFTHSINGLLIARFIQGAGCAAGLSTTNAIISTIFHSSRHHGFAIGLNASMYALGMGIGVVVGGLLVEYFGWRSIFILNSAFGLFVFIASLIILIEKHITLHKEKTHFDYLGGILFTLAIIGTTLSIIIYTNPISISWLPSFLIILGVSLFLIFIFLEHRLKTPFIDLNLFLIPAFAIGNAIRAVAGFLTASLLFVVPFFSIQSLGLSASIAGLILLPYALGVGISGPLGGHLSDKIGKKYIILTGFLICIFSIILLIILNYSNNELTNTWTYVKLIFGILLFGLSMGSINSANSSTSLKSIIHSKKGIASALLFTISFLANAISVAFCSNILSKKYTLLSQVTKAVEEATSEIFYVLLGIAIVGLLCTLFHSDSPKNKSTSPNKS